MTTPKPKEHPLVMELLIDTKWGIRPESLEQLIAIVEGKGSVELAALMRGERLSNTRNVSLLENGVAVIPMMGPIVPRASLFGEISGATSCQTIMQDFCEAIDNSAVKSIIFDVDSPGGSITGIHELAAKIKASRGIKPITAFVSGIGASAAYWLLSACDKVAMDPTAEVGSIGVVAAYNDDSEKRKKDGVQKVEIVSSASPKKRLNPNSAEGKQEIQQSVDDIADVMITNIADNRGVTSDYVNKNFGEGGMFVAKKAVQRKMADAVMTFDQLLNEESAKNAEQQSQQGEFYMEPTNATGAVAALTAATLQTGNPALHAAILEEGRKQGVADENARLAAIRAIKTAGYGDITKAAYKDPTITPERYAYLVMEEQKKRASTTATAEKSDAEKLAEQAARVGAGAPAAEGDLNQEIVAAMAMGGDSKRPTRTASGPQQPKS